ncbi:hypothetical protein BKP35_08915 [Anaerobacillus arseniciselenatis]|uniref:Uncharacterized protein n=1 Tax=Anaerobacillus arseniciselenatis TaxID=85682 RepID=A0A1S2LNF5_9BACI|nr:hypothetical protein BKP35_08915 [Anaerobacillus arseniciselenatis]
MVNSEFSIEDHEEYAEKIQDERGLTKEEADEEAFRVQLNELAVINRAIAVGISVSEEEALRKSQEIREVLKNGEAKNASEVMASIQKEIGQLEISEDEYWNEYMLSNYTHMVMREKLMEYERTHSGISWNERQQEIIEEFIASEKRRINEFKRKIGMK